MGPVFTREPMALPSSRTAQAHRLDKLANDQDDELTESRPWETLEL